MSVTQSYSDIQIGARDNFRADFSLNMVPGEVITGVTVTVPTGFTVNTGPIVGTVTVDAQGRSIFSEDVNGTWAEANISVGNTNDKYEIVWQATINNGVRILPLTFGLLVTPRS